MPSVNDQVAPAHHNHNQSYHPFYSVTTWKGEKKYISISAHTEVFLLLPLLLTLSEIHSLFSVHLQNKKPSQKLTYLEITQTCGGKLTNHQPPFLNIYCESFRYNLLRIQGTQGKILPSLNKEGSITESLLNLQYSC